MSVVELIRSAGGVIAACPSCVSSGTDSSKASLSFGPWYLTPRSATATDQSTGTV